MLDLDLTEHPFNKRLQMVRETRRISRAKLAELSGIPASSIEKYEYGHADPPVRRLQKIAEVLEVETDLLLHGTAGTVTAPEPEPIEDDFDPFEEEDEDIYSKAHVVRLLKGLDKMRVEGFRKYWRSAPRDIEAVQNGLMEFPFDALLDLAEERGLYRISEDVIESYDGLYPDEQETIRRAIAERIVDTAVFGRDLHTIDLDSLSDAAYELGIKADKTGLFYKWSSLEAVADALREHSRPLALKDVGPDFLGDQKFDEREVA